jgi:type II secretory pathway component PulC
VLKEIHQYHVVILRNGQRRILRLSKDASEWDEEPSLELKRGRLLDDYRNAILTGDYEKFVGVAGYRPAYKGSDMYGFEIVSQSKKGDAFLRQAGLEAGDVVTSINGHELATDFEYLKYLANNIKTMTDMNIGVERAGTILFFTYTTGASTEQIQAPQSPGAEPEKIRVPANAIQEGLLKDD